MTAFGAIPGALNVLYADPNIGESAEYTSMLTGVVKPVRVVVDRAEAAYDTAGFSVITTGRILYVRQSEIAELRTGDRFDLSGGLGVEGGVTLEVVGRSELDGVSGEWTAQVREISFDELDP